jgi:hypothetical protein
MKIKILLLLFFISGLAGAQEKIVPQYIIPIGWPISSPLYDIVKHNEYSALKNNKVKEIVIENEANKTREIRTFNKQGYPLVISNAEDGVLLKETVYEYNDDNFITLYAEMRYTGTGDLKSKDVFKFTYENDKPVKCALGDTSTQITFEASYNGDILSSVKTIIEKGGFKLPITEEVVYAGDSVVKRNKISKSPTFIIRKKDNDIFISDNDMYKRTIYTDGTKVEKDVINNNSIKYFYKENGLIDYVIKDTGSKESKVIYKYTYYED